MIIALLASFLSFTLLDSLFSSQLKHALPLSMIAESILVELFTSSNSHTWTLCRSSCSAPDELSPAEMQNLLRRNAGMRPRSLIILDWEGKDVACHIYRLWWQCKESPKDCGVFFHGRDLRGFQVHSTSWRTTWIEMTTPISIIQSQLSRASSYCNNTAVQDLVA